MYEEMIFGDANESNKKMKKLKQIVLFILIQATGIFFFFSLATISNSIGWSFGIMSILVANNIFSAAAVVAGDSDLFVRYLWPSLHVLSLVYWTTRCEGEKKTHAKLRLIGDDIRFGDKLETNNRKYFIFNVEPNSIATFWHPTIIQPIIEWKF